MGRRVNFRPLLRGIWKPDSTRRQTVRPGPAGRMPEPTMAFLNRSRPKNKHPKNKLSFSRAFNNLAPVADRRSIAPGPWPERLG